MRLKTLSLIGAALLLQLPVLADQTYGPENYFRTMKTPFGFGSKEPASTATDASDLAPIGIASSDRRTILQRISQTRLYLPQTMQLGGTEEFTIKGRPGDMVAIAMADKNKGAKPIFNHELRLGSDRKVVSIGQIPDSGVLVLNIETPIQGDLIGQSLYFEAATWSKDDMSDLQIARTIPSGAQSKEENGVLIAAEPDQKKGIRIVPEGAKLNRQLNVTTDNGVMSGKP